MALSPAPPRGRRPAGRRVAALLLFLAWLALVVIAAVALRPDQGLLVSLAATFAAVAFLLLARWDEYRRWEVPVRLLAGQVRELARGGDLAADFVAAPELADLTRSLRELKKSWASLPATGIPIDVVMGAGSGDSGAPARPVAALTRSGYMRSIPLGDAATQDGQISGEFFIADMVNRLEPKGFRWLESSPAEQEFLGWNQEQLRQMSFLDIVSPEDQQRVRDQLHDALSKGEVHGLVVKIRTAAGHPRWVELNVGARYGPGLAVSYLRCHLADVTDKVRAERQLHLRNLELNRLNEQLRAINRELEELKDRYSDLYQNAPAMYFSLDREARFLECNDTFLNTLGYTRDDLIGHPVERILSPARRVGFQDRFAAFLRSGAVEMENEWVKAGGEVINVWVSGTTVPGRDGAPDHARIVAQDITLRLRLQAELVEKNERLARVNEELSRKNKEMDEFTYVVSHDLQEPLRTLIAFSDFLERDCADRLDDNGREYVRYLVEASRRMRAMIHGLLTLSRAGRVTGEFEPVNLEVVVSVVRADLAELIRSRGAEVRVAGPLPTLWGDRHRISQLMANLIGNGLKYNRSEEPWVEVGTAPDAAPSWATVFVRDNGIGIDPQFHGKVFQLFRRLHAAEEYEGTGAGLAICSKIVQAHGGKIWVESQSGRGATFWVRLPRAAAAASRSPTEASHAT